MNIQRDLPFIQLQKRVAVLEKAFKELIEMNSMMHLEISSLKKKIGGEDSEEKTEGHSSSNTNEELDIPQIQRALRMQQGGSMGVQTLGRAMERPAQ